MRNMSGYLSGLSSPSVTDDTMTRTSSPTRNSAGQTRFPTFSIDEQIDLVERQIPERRAHHVGVEVALPAEARIGVELGDRNVQARQAVGVHRPLHVALEHADPDAGQAPDDALEERRLPRPGRAHEVHDRDSGAIEVVAVGTGDRVVGVERLLDDLHLGAMHSASSTSIDSTRSSSPLATATSPVAARRAPERGDLDRPLVRAGVAAQGRSSRAPARAGLPRTPSRARRTRSRTRACRGRPGAGFRPSGSTTATRRPSACFSTVLTIARLRDSSCTPSLPSADPRQWVAHELVHHSPSAEARLHQHHRRRLGAHLADLGRLLAARAPPAERPARRRRPRVRRTRPACPRWPRTSGRSRGSPPPLPPPASRGRRSHAQPSRRPTRAPARSAPRRRRPWSRRGCSEARGRRPRAAHRRRATASTCRTRSPRPARTRSARA